MKLAGIKAGDKFVNGSNVALITHADRKIVCYEVWFDGQPHSRYECKRKDFLRMAHRSLKVPGATFEPLTTKR